jgi:hypothetical protein
MRPLLRSRRRRRVTCRKPSDAGRGGRGDGGPGGRRPGDDQGRAARRVPGDGCRSGALRARPARRLREIEGVAEGSTTETYAPRLEIERVDAVDLDARIYAKAVVTVALQEFPAPRATCEFKTESRCVPRGEADAPTSVFRLFGSGMTLRGFGSPAPPMGFVGRWPVGLGRREACDDLLLVEERVFARLVER